MNHPSKRLLAVVALLCTAAVSNSAEKDSSVPGSLLIAESDRAAIEAHFAQSRAETAERLASGWTPDSGLPSTISYGPVAPAEASPRFAGGIETFEETFPDAHWTVSYSDSAQATWGDSSCRASAGTWSGGCAAGGPAATAACDNYLDNMRSVMSVEGTYAGRTFNGNTQMTFEYLLQEEACCDRFTLLVEGWTAPPLPSTPPDITYSPTLDQASGFVTAAITMGTDFDAVNYMRFSFIFESDESVSNFTGAWVDNAHFFDGAMRQFLPAPRGFDGLLDDMWEPNDSVEQGYNASSVAVNTTYSAIMRDEEWYRISLPTGNAMRATVNGFNPALDNIQVQLFDDRVGNSDGFPLRLSDSYGTTDTESLTFVDRTAISTATPNTGFLFLRVYSEDPPSGQSYDIRIDDLGRDDAFEPNNGPCQFIAVSTNTTYDNLICGDDDVFFVNTTGLTEIDVQVEHVATWGQLYFQVIENDGSCGFPVIGNDYRPNNNTLFSTTNVAGRDNVLVRVYGSNLANANIYSLRVTGR